MFTVKALGGKVHSGKQLYVASRYIAHTSGRKKLIVLGSGWACYSVLKKIDTKKYDVILVSPRNHFLFTPLLCSTTVGTLEFR